MGSQEVITIENDFTLIRFQNDGNENFHVKKHVNQGLIQFHFGIKGNGKFIFNQGNYALDLKEEKAKERILKRAEKENRQDDKDPEVIAKRFKEYLEKTSPLIDKYKKSRKLVTVDASEGSESVYDSVVKKLDIPSKKKDEGKKKGS
jgi:hypothetical protein